jgi:hypothetical protein
MGNAGFIRRATALALRHPRPLGFLNGFKVRTEAGGKRGIGIKQSGLFPIIEVARAEALDSSLGLPSTLDRLRRGAARPDWSEMGKSADSGVQVNATGSASGAYDCARGGPHGHDSLEPKALDRLTRLHIKGVSGCFIQCLMKSRSSLESIGAFPLKLLGPNGLG